MGTIDQRWRHSVTRREALLGLAGFLASSPLLRAQQDLGRHMGALGAVNAKALTRAVVKIHRR